MIVRFASSVIKSTQEWCMFSVYLFRIFKNLPFFPGWLYIPFGRCGNATGLRLGNGHLSKPPNRLPRSMSSWTNFLLCLSNDWHFIVCAVKKCEDVKLLPGGQLWASFSNWLSRSWCYFSQDLMPSGRWRILLLGRCCTVLFWQKSSTIIHNAVAVTVCFKVQTTNPTYKAVLLH